MSTFLQIEQVMSNLELINTFRRLETRSQGSLGVSALRLGDGNRDHSIAYNAEKKFFMCSTFKVPIAICFLQRVERENIKLTDTVAVTEFDLRVGVTSTLNQFDYSHPVNISYENLLQYMLQESCNSSSDIIFRAAGGAAALRKFFSAAGITDMAITKSILEIFAAWDGIKNLPADGRVTLEQYKKLEQAVTPAQLAVAKSQYQPQDGDATPVAMNKLMEKFVKRELLTEQFTDWLLNVMRGCKTGKMRLKGLLPKEIDVAHKTGTITGCCCDVGLIDGDLVVTAFLKNAKLDAAACERIIAEVGLAVYEWFKGF
jgi:beta-lactamase class A